VRVHEVVDVATSDGPPLRHTVDEIVGSGRRAQRRRRAGWATAGAAGLAVVAVSAFAAVPALTAGPGTTAVAPAAGPAAVPAKKGPAAFAVPDDPFTFTFSAFTAGRFHVQNPIVASTAYQIASVYADGMVSNDKAADPKDVPSLRLKGRGVKQGPPELYAYLVLYRPGAYNPDGLKGASKLTVAGHQARQVSDSDPSAGHKVLAWEYTKGAWAVLESFGEPATPTAGEMQAVVSGLTPSSPAPATLPFKMGYVPAGYTAAELGTHAMAGLNGVAAARDGDFGGAIFTKPGMPTTGLTEPYGGTDGNDLPGSFQVFVVPSENSNQQLGKAKPPAGPKCGHGFCSLWTSDGKVQVQVASDGRLSDAEMSKIAKGVKLADVNDDTSWFDAAAALAPKS
jgi:hypothetical protein